MYRAGRPLIRHVLLCFLFEVTFSNWAAFLTVILLTRLPPEAVGVGVVSLGQQTVSLLGPLHKGIADAVLQGKRGRKNWEFSHG